MAPERGRAWLALLAALVAVGCAVAAAVWWSSTPPAGPVEVAFDRVRCERCGMLVSEPGFAAQLHTPDGRVRFFDDPGCLLLHLEQEPAVHRVWFHHRDEARWVSREDVVFESVDPSPMGYGLAARARGELDGGGMDLAAARRQVLERERTRRGGRAPGATR